jgi:hypothetical protein
MIPDTTMNRVVDEADDQLLKEESYEVKYFTANVHLTILRRMSFPNRATNKWRAQRA